MNEEKLIEQVRTHSSLYDINSSDYKDQTIRNEAWREIGEHMKLSADKCKFEWTKLRSGFLNATRRRRLKSSGQSTKIISPWKFTQQMEFLLPYLESRLTNSNLTQSSKKHVEMYGPNSNIFDDISNISNKEIEEVQQDTQNEAESLGLNPPSQKKKRNDNCLENVGIMKVNADLYREIFEQNISEPQNGVELFYLRMAKVAKRLPKVEEAKLRMKVCKVVTEAELGCLEFTEPRSDQQYCPNSSKSYHILQNYAYSQVTQPITPNEDMFEKPNGSYSCTNLQ